MTLTGNIAPVTDTAFCFDFILAANVGFLESPTTRVVAWVIGLLVVLGAAWGAAIVSGSKRRKKQAKQSAKQPESKDVFDEICAAQGLLPEEKRQLLGAATTLELASPALLFVDSGLLNQLSASDRKDAGEFRKLAGKLFPAATGPSEEEIADLAETSTVA